MDLVLNLVLLIGGVSLTFGSSVKYVPGCRCFHLYRPVCGDDGRTYGNHCEAQCQGVTVVSREPCPINETSTNEEIEGHSLTSDIKSQFGLSDRVRTQSRPADCFCPFTLHPVCGTDGRTYPSQCAATCRGIDVEHDGRCRSSEEDSRGRHHCMCPPISAQVCGEDGLTYENACLARCRQVRIVSREPCLGSSVVNPEGSGPCACPPMVKPVCGRNHVTYDNHCKATCNNQEVLHQGPCGEQTAEEPCVCNMRFRPVCGNNGRTYPNACRARCDGQIFTRGRC